MKLRNQDVFLAYGRIPEYCQEFDEVVQMHSICTIIGQGGTGKSALFRYWRDSGSHVVRPTKVLIVTLVDWRHSYKLATHMFYARCLDALHTHAPPAYVPQRLFRRYDADYYSKKSAEALRKDVMGRLAQSSVMVIIFDGTDHLDKAAFSAVISMWEHAPLRRALLLAGQPRNASDDKQINVWLAGMTVANQAWKHAIEMQRPTVQELRGTKEQKGLLLQLLEDVAKIIVPADEHRRTSNVTIGKLIAATQCDWGSIARLLELFDAYAEPQSGSNICHITPQTLRKTVDKLRFIDPSAMQQIEQETDAAQPAQPPANSESVISLTDQQRTALEQARDSHEKSAVRERAAAMLQVSMGKSLREIAAGLPKAKNPETIRSWIRRYIAEGLVGLETKSGQGRKPKTNEAPETEAVPK